MTTDNRYLDLTYSQYTEDSELEYEGRTEEYDVADYVKPLKGVRIA